VANNNQIYKMSNAGGFKSLNRYYDMLAGNTVWNPWSPDGAYDALATVTVPSGGLASVTFAAIPNTYKHLQIRVLGATTTAAGDGAYFNIRFNSDSGSNYSYHDLFGNGSSVTASGLATQTAIYGQRISEANLTSIFGGVVMDVLDYGSVNKNKTVRSLGGYDANGSGSIYLISGAWYNSSTAINSITLTPDANLFAQYSQFSLYGVK